MTSEDVLGILGFDSANILLLKQFMVLEGFEILQIKNIIYINHNSVFLDLQKCLAQLLRGSFQSGIDISIPREFNDIFHLMNSLKIFQDAAEIKRNSLGVIDNHTVNGIQIQYLKKSIQLLKIDKKNSDEKIKNLEIQINLMNEEIKKLMPKK
ncbi:MAG: hypothetical protein Hyperionvirus3_70 [Hyperionvirus sp.]|uniref:Uncharacterized protein n=1 Tax=Hyperionvirus sp. TaxID=2487770 RepID=A0A3G5A8V3_9VIRU|nr:MAG: hypothetical protein Hyperionvirus3_70 [Hyperionvirus sp.]